MGFFKKKKYTEGSAKEYITRSRALKKLQLNLKDFRRLCIIKGIYPREPKNRKAAQKGKGGIDVLYAVKDILFLASDPMMWQIRKFKTYMKDKGKAKGQRNFSLLRRMKKSRPTLDMDHVVRERYPSFIDALRDLDDCLSLLFLYAKFPRVLRTDPMLPSNARKLTVEFMHLVIEARALRRVFVSIKGIYYQVELRGQTITWSVPHDLGDEPDKRREVDMRVMGYFADFYCVLLGFVNFRLYQQHNLIYPPRLTKLSGDESEKRLVQKESYFFERMASLNVSLFRRKKDAVPVEEDLQLDNFPMSDDPELVVKLQKEIARNAKVKTLFSNVKAFINREVPREPMAFCIRACGGQVSWDRTLFVGSTFTENDETITHHIVDRPSMEKQYISRYYVQPQWVFDSINAAELLPIENYLIGAVLPPHLSPFADPRGEVAYKPPEELAQLDEEATKYQLLTMDKPKETEDSDESDLTEEEDDDDKVDEDTRDSNPKGKESSSDSEAEDIRNEESERLEKKKKMAVKKGTIPKVDKMADLKHQFAEKKLLERMVKNKHRHMYTEMMKTRKEKLHRINVLTRKRKEFDEAAAATEKAEKKQRRRAAASLEA